MNLGGASTDAPPPFWEGARRRLQSRFHILAGDTCNNNCLFCMEGNRDGRYVADNSIVPEEVRSILEQNRGAEEVFFQIGYRATAGVLGSTKLSRLDPLQLAHLYARLSEKLKRSQACRLVEFLPWLF